MFPAALVLLPIIFGIALYFYGFLCRAIKVFGIPADSRRAKTLIACAAVLLGGGCFFFTSVYALFVLHLFALALFFDLVRFFVGWGTKKKYPRFFSRFYTVTACGILPVLLSLAVILGGVLNMNAIRPTYYTLTTEKTIRNEGYRVAFLADLHLGTSLSLADVEALCERIEKERIDLLILGGDIVDEGTDRAQIPALFTLFADVESKYGTYFVFGNHDRSRRAKEDLTAIIEASGVTVLRDEGVMLTDDLLLVGREDRGFGGKDDRLPVADLLAPYSEHAFRLVVDHQPSEYAENGAAGTDLILSGHTHGGQIFPLNLLQRIVPFNDAVYGVTAIGNGGTAIVSAGVAGWGYPVKTAAPAEYLIVDIHPTK